MTTLTANMGKGSGLTAGLGKGSSLTASLGSGAVSSGYGTEYQAVYDSLTTKPSASIATAQNTFVQTGVTDGWWVKLDVLYNFAQTVNTAGEALKNWILPGTYDATAYNSPTFTALEGFTGASTKYIDCNWIPSTNGVNYTLNSASFGCYIRSNILEATVDCGIYLGSGGRTLIYSRHANGNGYIQINAAAFDGAVNSDGRGMFIGNRVLSNEQDLYKNGSRLINASENSTSVSSISFNVLARNNDGVADSFSTKQLSCFFAGGGLTSGDVTSFTNAFEVYMDSNSKGVIT